MLLINFYKILLGNYCFISVTFILLLFYDFNLKCNLNSFTPNKLKTNWIGSFVIN